MPRAKPFLSEFSGIATLSLSFQCYIFLKKLSMNEGKAVNVLKLISSIFPLCLPDFFSASHFL